MLIVSSILEVLLSGRPFSDKLLCGDNFSFTEKLQIVLGAPASPCSVSPHISIVCDCNVLIKANAGIVEFRVLFGICFSTGFLVLFQDAIQDTTWVWLYVCLLSL